MPAIRQIRQALHHIRRNVHHSGWLHQNEPHTLGMLRLGLSTESLYLQALATLLTALPYVHESYDAWTTLMWAALESPEIEYRAESVSRLYTALASFYTHAELYGQAEEMLNKANGWLSTDMADKVVAESCICLVEALLYRFDQRLSEGLLETLLRHARAVSDPQVLARAQHILCRAYTVRGDFDNAIHSGRHALRFFTRLRDSYAIFRSALSLAKAYRAGGDYTMAQRQLETAQGYLGEQVKPKERGDLYYELGVVAYAQGVISDDRRFYEAAAPHFQMAMDHYAQTDAPYRHAAFYHARGLLLLRLTRFDEALASLELAEESWARLDNPYESANSHYARSFVEAKRGNLPRARQMAHEAVAIMGPLPDMPSCDELHADVQQHIRHLMNGFYQQPAGE